MESGSTGSSTPIDPTRKYGKPDPLNRNNFLCNFCSKITKGGEYLMKQHLVGGFKNVTKCPQCPEHIREEVKNFMLKKEEVKTTNLMSSQDFSYGADDQEEEDELEMFDSSGPNSSKRSRKLLPKKTRTKGPMDMFVAAKANPHKEGSVQVAFDKQLREKTCRAIAKFFYDVRIAFNAATYRSFKQMCEAIGQYGHGLKVPSMHELRVPLLKKDVDDTKIVMEGQQKGWAEKGCSILSNGWRESIAQKDIVNFLVNFLKGTYSLNLWMFRKLLRMSTCYTDCLMIWWNKWESKM
ncbi:hypothetical protein V6N13_072802 [Hibiscus sabdariffa]